MSALSVCAAAEGSAGSSPRTQQHCSSQRARDEAAPDGKWHRAAALGHPQGS